VCVRGMESVNKEEGEEEKEKEGRRTGEWAN
jgi:hypothetical protein